MNQEAWPVKSPEDPPPLLLDGAGAWEDEELGVQAGSAALLEDGVQAASCFWLDSLQTFSDEDEGAASGVHWLLEEDGATH